LSYKRLVDRISEEVSGELFVIDTSLGRVSPATIQAQSDQADLVIVDYAGLLSTPMGNRAVDDWRSMASISNMLKEVSVATSVPIISAAQINRDGDGAGWKPPRVKNLAQSDALGQDADVVITHKRYSKSTAVASIEKNRHGASGDYFWTRFQPDEGRFEEITREQADDIKDLEEDDD
jgi:replicative DNA helicase